MHLNRFARKLNNKSGNSIMMALLLLLVATVVSIVIVTVALTSTMHVDDNRTSQQEYLACVSAAEMLRDGLNGSEYVYKDQTWTYTWTYTEKEWSWSSGWSNVTKTDTETLNEYPEDTNSKILENFVTELSTAVRQDESKNTAAALITKAFTITQSDENIYDVEASCSLWYKDTNSYVLKINLETIADDDSVGYRMSMSIPIKCDISNPETVENQTHKCKTSSSSKSHYNNNDTDRKNKQHSTFAVSTITTTITWGQGKISKGWS